MYGARQGGGVGPIVLVPGGLFWTRRRTGVGFRWVVPDTHDYFLPQLKAGRLSSKSGLDMIISCGDLRFSSKMVQNPCLVGGPGVPNVAPEPSLYMVLRAVWLVALVFQNVAPEPPPWPVGVLVVAPGLDGVMY